MQPLPQLSQNATPQIFTDDIKDNKQKKIDANVSELLKLITIFYLFLRLQLGQ
jgi:hypothetical protein